MINFGAAGRRSAAVPILKIWALSAAFCLGVPARAESLPSPPAALSYADLADLALAAPAAAHVRLTDAIRVEPERAVGLAPNETRFYVSGDVIELFRAPQPLPATIAWLVDLPNGTDGKPPRLKRKTDYIVLGEPVAGRPGEFRLVAPDAQLPYSDAVAGEIKAILAEAAKPNAPPAITGIGRAFHVAGTLPGEGETQIFLLAAGGRPISLSILRRPGEQPRWGVALSEIVDDAAAPPQRDTLLWYRLACTLPKELPDQSLADAQPDQLEAIRTDYRLVLESLGPCIRTRR